MKLSKKTISILKNFVGINNSIAIKSGSSISTIAVTKNIYAAADIEEEFPINFSIYDLSEFVLSFDLFSNDPELKFENDKFVTFVDGKNSVKYFFTDPEVIISPPDKKPNLGECQFRFTLDSIMYEKMLKSICTMKFPDLCIESDGSDVKLIMKDKDNSTSNSFSIEVGTSTNRFRYNLKTENFKILKGNYNVELYGKAVKFSNTADSLEYIIALEPDSTFEQL